MDIENTAAIDRHQPPRPSHAGLRVTDVEGSI